MSKDDQIKELLERGVEDVIVREDLEKKLKAGRKLRFKLGIDPTAPDLHIGRAVVLWKLRQLQDMGHTITLVIGNFTGVIGDASDKSSERPMLDRKTVEDNLKRYKDQIGKILDMSKVELYFNADWFDKMDLGEFVKLASLFTIQQMTERENFAKRINDNKPVGLHETLYPLLQGYDSVAMKTDVEVGGSDQLFNMLAGRVVQRAYDMEPQNVIVFGILEGTDGRKMSTSWGNCIYIADEPADMYGKVMSLHDDLIIQYLRLATDVAEDIIKQIEFDMSEGSNPRDSKAFLARTIVARYHGEKAANLAEKSWNEQFREGSIPEDIEDINVEPETKQDLADLIATEFELSKSEARRLLEQNGIKINRKVVKDTDYQPADGDIIQVGKRRFKRIKLKK